MPFKERSIMLEREEFCRLASEAGVNFRALCRGWGISPTTGYKWLGRWQSTGRPGLADRPRRPQRSPARCEAGIEDQILAVRREHPAWGGRKIRHVLMRAEPVVVPAASTITAVLRRHGLLDGPRAGMARAYQRFEREHPNELWQMDFKGHFAIAEGRCHPLTVLDDHSRYALVLSACANEQGETVRERLEQAFRRYGLPQRILTDNGPPWGTAGAELHTPLTVWLLDLGVAVGHSRPRHPQTMGKDERFHRSLKAEVLARGEVTDLTACQAAFDAWREVYNTYRPHEALDMKTPIDRYTPSDRSMPETIAPPDYEETATVRKVQTGGWLSFRGRTINCPKAFVGRRVALRATETDGVFDICYRRYPLAQVDLREGVTYSQPVHHVSERVSTISPV